MNQIERCSRRSSERIVDIYNKKFKLSNDKYNTILHKLHITPDVKEKMKIVCTLFTHLTCNFYLLELLITDENEVSINRYMLSTFIRTHILQNEMRIHIQKGIKIKMKYMEFKQIIKKMNKQILIYFYAKLKALCDTVILNDDVVFLIYSYV